jgi:hypothetical protein
MQELADIFNTCAPEQERELDSDGLPIPDSPLGPYRREVWEKMPPSLRAKLRARWLGEEPPKEPKPRRPAAKRYTTEYAIKWGRKQGWRLLDRERYDARLKRHHDLILGADAMFDGGERGLVLVQGAGKSERAEHRRRFEAGGGEARCKALHISFVYIEFVREDYAPIKEEHWA